MSATPYPDLNALATHFRNELAPPAPQSPKKFILLYAYNGTGKTRLSTAFKDMAKQAGQPDTLYFNAFTEDLFSWDNDLANDRERVLRFNRESSFFNGLNDLEMNVKVGQQLERYADLNFDIDYEKSFIVFFRERDIENNPLPIKVSRGEENIFIWCFFLAIVQIVVDADEDNPYEWVKYIYIDDPISSLDEQNAVKVAHDLTYLLSGSDEKLGIVISTHHALFYNVIANRIGKKASKVLKIFLRREEAPGTYLIEDWENVPPFYHLTTLVDLSNARNKGELAHHHFNMLRRVLEQTAAFFGYDSWVECLRAKEGESEKAFQKRVLDLSSHGDYVIFESPFVDDEMRSVFQRIFEEFRQSFPFNTKFFPPSPIAVPTTAPSPVTAATPAT